MQNVAAVGTCAEIAARAEVGTATRGRARPARVRLDPQTTVLLVIDLQNDTVGEEGAFASAGAAAFAKEHGVVEQASRLADAFRARGSARDPRAGTSTSRVTSTRRATPSSTGRSQTPTRSSVERGAPSRW